MKLEPVFDRANGRILLVMLIKDDGTMEIFVTREEMRRIGGNAEVFSQYVRWKIIGRNYLSHEHIFPTGA